MSTRSNVQFQAYGRTVANIYVHSDGYPDYSVPRIYRFFNTVQEQCERPYGTRFTDPSYLAAKFVVFLAVYEFGEYGGESVLAFGSVGIMEDDAGDGEYTYFVDCENMDDKGFPKVTYSPSGSARKKGVQGYRDSEQEKAQPLLVAKEEMVK